MLDLLLRLFNLHDVDFESAEGWSLRFTSDWASPIALLGAIALVVLVWRVYRREKGTASPRYKLMLALFRVAALTVLMVILLQPAVVVSRSELKESYVLILADKSDSMDLRDRYQDDERVIRLAHVMGLATPAPGEALPADVAERVRAMSRAEIANRTLENARLDVIGRIARNARVQQFVFARTVEQAPTAAGPVDDAPADTDADTDVPRPLVIRPDGPVTQIGESIRDVVARFRGQRIAAMVILSDWCSNSGLSPVEATRFALSAESTFPIYAVGVGDPAEQRDIAVPSVSANPVAFVNDPLLFDVAIEQSGYDGATVPLELRVGDDVVETRDVMLEPGRQYHTITHTPTEKGVFKYVVSIAPRPGELSDENNEAERTVTVKDDKIRVLLIAGFPTWEWRYLKSALVRDESLEVSVWLQAADADWVMAGGTQLRQMPLNKKELIDNYDAIIMLAPAPEAFSEEQLENVRSFVRDFGGGLIFCAGEMVDLEAFAQTPLAKCLPVSLEPAPGIPVSRSTTESFRPTVTPEGWASPVTTLLEDETLNRDLWLKLPGFFWFYPVKEVKPGAHVLSVHPEEQNEHGPFPIFVDHIYGSGRVFFSATDETWRWRFVLGDKHFYRFWRQNIGLTAASKLLGGSKRLTLSVAQNTYTVGQRVEIEAKVLDDLLRPADAPSFQATIDLPGGTTQPVQLSLAAPGQGLYRGSFVPRRLGSYAVWMRIDANSKPETAPFSVTMSTLENESRRLDVETMQAVAKKTAGAAFTIDQIGQLPDLIKAESVNVTTKHPTDIWDSWGFLILFVVPLSLEWWLRKRRLLT